MANRKPEAQSSASIGLEARLPKAINQDAFAAEKVRILEKSISLADSVVPYLKGRGSEQFAEEYNVCSADTSRIHAAVA